MQASETVISCEKHQKHGVKKENVGRKGVCTRIENNNRILLFTLTRLSTWNFSLNVFLIFGFKLKLEDRVRQHLHCDWVKDALDTSSTILSHRFGEMDDSELLCITAFH